MGYYSTYGSYGRSSASTAGVLTALILLTTIAAVILAYIFIIPEKRRAVLNKFGQFLHDLLNFKFLIIEKILQFCYVFLTALCVCGGFFSLFESFGAGLLIMILGPISVRVIYEMAMMFIILIKNVIKINNKLKDQNEGKTADVFSQNNMKQYAPAQPVSTPVAPAVEVPSAKFCVKCGSTLDDDGKCPNCQ